MTRRRGRRRKKLLDVLKDRRGYCQLKEEALDRTTMIPRLTSDPANDFSANEDFFAVFGLG